MQMPETSEETSQAVSGRRRSQRLWAVLLVLDAFFVIIFGGALAAKVYQHWQAPPAPSTPRKGKPRQAAKAEVPRPTPPAPPEPAKPPEEPKAQVPAPQAPPVAPSRPAALPRPSLVQEIPKPRETPKPQEPARAPEKAPAQAEKPSPGKAIPVHFQLKAPGAKRVELVGAFIVRGGRKPMLAHEDGLWTLTLYLTPNTYRYFFVVNGKKTLDPKNPTTDRGASAITVP